MITILLCSLNAKRDFLKTTWIVGGSEMSRERVRLFCFRHVGRLMLPICTAVCFCPTLQNNFTVLCRLRSHNTEGGTRAKGVGEQGAEEDIWRLRVLENKVLRRIFGGWGCWKTRCWGGYLEAEGVSEQGAEEDIWAHEGLGDRGSGKDYNTRRSKIRTSHHIFGWWNQKEWNSWGMWNIRETGKEHTGLWLGDLRETTTWKTEA